MVKKQTIWLLTMLSLVVVLSIYYVMTPPLQQSNPVNLDNKGETTKITTSQTTKSNKDVFTQLRLDIEDERSAMKEEFEKVLASNTESAAEKNKALESMAQLKDLSTKEDLIETLLKTEKDINDCLVKTDNNDVTVYVVANKSDASLANTVIKVVENELGNEKNIAVTFKGEK